MVGGISMTIKNYEVVIKTLGPVHIGSGQVMKKQDYIYDFYNSKVYMINGNKLVKFLKRKNLLDTYQNFLKYPPKNSRATREKGLKDYLDAQNVKQSEWKAFINYSEKVNHGKKYDTKRLNDIHIMVRDGQNKVYLPGSSIKGAIKTALVSKYDNEKNKDIYSKIKVSDSEPIDECHLAIYQKIDVNKSEKPMPLYRECVDVDNEIKFKLTIEDEIYSINEIEQSIRDFYKNYYDKWLVGFKETKGGRRFALEGGMPDVLNQNILFLGAGAGFVSKTTHYQRRSREQAKRDSFKELTEQFPKIYGNTTGMPSNVPIVLKGTTNQSRHTSYQQGMCEISFQELNNEVL